MSANYLGKTESIFIDFYLFILFYFFTSEKVIFLSFLVILIVSQTLLSLASCVSDVLFFYKKFKAFLSNAVKLLGNSLTLSDFDFRNDLRGTAYSTQCSVMNGVFIFAAGDRYNSQPV